MEHARSSPPRPAGESGRRHSGTFPSEPSGITYRPADFEHSVRVDESGRALAGHGRVHDMAALTAYVCNVGDVIGEQLGLGKLLAFEAQRQPGAYFLYRDAARHAVALIPRPHVGLERLRARLNL